ncbi:MAG TPA: hypothetical protein DDX98_13005 [Bacteroidales bacterium]|jgi:hypothetical protein|nr:hypothetical protein [Bacteroidales bacterium]
MEFKKLEIKPEGNWFKRYILSTHGKRTLLFIGLGAIGGVLYFYFTEGQYMKDITTGNILKSLLIGGFFGLFITNSPCARGRC